MRKHIIFDRTIPGMLVSMALAALTYILCAAVGNQIFGAASFMADLIQIPVLFFCLLVHRLWFHGELHGFFRVKGLKKGILLGWSMLLVAAIVALNKVFGGEELGSLPYALFLGLIPGFSEEVLFRVLPLSIAMRQETVRRNPLFVCFLPGVLFGIIHSANVLIGADPIGTLLQVVYAIAIGILLAGIYVRTGNMWAVIFLHSIVDAASFLTKRMQQAGGVLTDSNNILEIIILVLFTIAFYINALLVLRKSGEAADTWKEMWH